MARPPFTRWIFPSLGLGLLTAVVVAWCIALLSNPEMETVHPLDSPAITRPDHASRAFVAWRPGTVQVVVYDFPEPLSERDALASESMRAANYAHPLLHTRLSYLVSPRADDSHLVIARVYGFPLPCLSAHYAKTNAGHESRRGAVKVREARIPEILRDFGVNQAYPLDGHLPLRPHLLGMTANTAAYSLLWLLLLPLLARVVVRARDALRGGSSRSAERA